MKKIIAMVIVIAMTVALGVAAFAETVYTDTDGGIIWDAAFWLSNDSESGGAGDHSGRTIDAVINASGPISGLGVPNYWASNPATEGQTNAVVCVKVFKFVDNYAKTKKGTPVAIGEITLAGDSNVGETTEVAGTNCKIKANGNAGIMLTFDSALAAGQYVVEFSQVSQSDALHYLVLPMTQKAYPSDAVAYYRNGVKDENLTLRLAVDLDGELLTLIPDGEDTPDQPVAEGGIDGVISDGEYDETYAITKDNFKTWTASPNMDGKEFTYFFSMKEDGLYVGVNAKGANAGDLMQMNFNPGNKLADVPGLFISFKLGDTLTVLQHNHKTGILDNDSAGGADITDKIENKIVKTADGYAFEVKLPVDFFKVTDVDGADSFVYGTDPLYYGMFAVVGGQGYTNQSNAPGSDWTCNGLGLTEYSFIIETTPDTQPQTGDATVAMFAVIAVLAMGAAVVFMKKKEF